MIIAVDTETTGLYHQKGDRPFIVTMTDYSGKDYYWRFPVDPFTREVNYWNNDGTYSSAYKEIKELLSWKQDTYVFHNCLFDIGMLRAIGIEVKGQVCDTMLLADAADNSRLSYGLKGLAHSILGWDNSDEKELHKSAAEGRRKGKKLGYKLGDGVKADFHLADPEICKKYALEDTRRTMALYKHYEQLFKNPKDFVGTSLENYGKCLALEHSLIEPTLKMNQTGMCVDLDKLNELETYYQGIVDKCNNEIKELGYEDFNPRSSQQKQEIFYEQMGMPVTERRRKAKDGGTSKSRSVDKKTLAQWKDTNKLASVLLELSEASKQLTGFVQPLRELSVPESSSFVIKPSFNIVGAHATGRYSCSNPNFQNLSKDTSAGRLSTVDFRLREAFVPRPGHYWILADYEQIEVINAAYLSGDRLLIDTLEQGKSFHDLTCDSLFSMKADFAENRKKYRNMSKNINFAMFYGVGPKKLAEQIGCDLLEAVRIWKAFWATYKGIKAFSDKLAEEVEDKGYVTDIFGRTYRTPPEASYKAFNRIIQGTSAGVLKRAFKEVVYRLRHFKGHNVLALVHDEIITEIPDYLSEPEELGPVAFGRMIKEAMQQDFHTLIGKPTPLGVGVSMTMTNWNTKQELIV